MNIHEAVYRAITNRAPSTEGGPVGSVVREVRAAFGTRAPKGISDRTWRRARSDPNWKPSARIADALRAAQRRARLSPGRERWLRRAHVGVQAKTIVSSDERERRIILNRWPGWRPGDAGRIIDHFLAGRDDQLGNPILDAIERTVPDMELVEDDERVDTVQAVRFFRNGDDADRWAGR